MLKIIEHIKRRRIKNGGKQVEALRAFTPMKHARTLAVLYRADLENAEALTKKLQEFCRANHLKLFTFGYFDDKELNTPLIPTATQDFFCNKHLDFFKLPHKTEFQRFSTEKFDYLLNLYSKPCLPLLGISAFAEAAFRVGPHWPAYSFCFDLMLETDKTDLMHFTDEVLIYLKNFGNG